MATKEHKPFEQRVKRISRDYEKIKVAGANPRLRKDGLIEMRPARPKLRLPLRPILLILAMAFGFKVFVYNYLGPEDYEARLAALDAANPVERAGQFILQADPATLWLTQQVGRLL